MEHSAAEETESAHKKTETELLKERITRAQEARQGLAKEREAKAKAEAETVEGLTKRAELEEIAFADEQAVAKAEVDLGERGLKFATIQTPWGLIILKPANTLKYKRFQDVGKYTSFALEELLRPCVHYPALTRLDAILAEFPGVLLKSADALAELANGTRKETEGKS